MRRSADGREYALKLINLKEIAAKEREMALNEVRLLASMRHDHVISYKEAFFDESSGNLWFFLTFSTNFMNFNEFQ